MTTKQQLSKTMTSPDETMAMPRAAIALAKFGGQTVVRATFEPGWKWSECVKPLAQSEWCQGHHTGYAVAGRVHVLLQDGTETEINAGDAYDIPPGHDAWVIGDESAVHVEVTGNTGSPGAAAPS